MTVISGAKAGFWSPHVEAVSVAATAEAMTEVGSTLEYYITDRAHACWDPTKAVVIYDNVTPVVPSRIDYAGGYVTLATAPSQPPTCDVYCFDLEALGADTGGFSGSEIEQVVVSALYTAFSANAVVDTEALSSEIRATRPLSVTMAEHMDALRAWAQGRTVLAN